MRQGNYVYTVKCLRGKFVVRLSEEKEVYKETVYWLERLADLNIPVPKVLAKGFSFLYINVLCGFYGRARHAVYG